MALDLPPLDRLPVPAWLDMPGVMLPVMSAVCVLLLAIAMVRVARVKPVLYSAYAFGVVALTGGVLQLGEAWWKYSVTVLILLTLSTLAMAAEVGFRHLTRQHVATVAALAGVNIGAYLYLAAVLAAHS